MIKIFEYNNSPVQFEEMNGQVMANATLMCQAFNKRAHDWLKTAQTQRYIEAISITKKIVPADLVVVRNGGAETGTWIHEKLILSLARWLDVEFELWCDEKIAELLRTGSTSIAKPLSTLDMLELSIKQLREQESRVSAIENKVLEIEAKTNTRPEYFTIIGYATLNRIQVGLQLASKLGAKAARICKNNGYPMDEIPDPRFGRVKSYPKTVLQQVFSEAVS